MKRTLFRQGDIQTMQRGRHFLRRAAQVSAMALVLASGGCRLVNVAPNNADALLAVRDVISEAGIPLPQSFQLKQVQVVSCVWQDSPDGHMCNVTLVSTELPIIGSISLPMSFRFARRNGQWKAFLM